MPPLPDVNLVLCGLATIAASVGYAFSRKFSPNITSAVSVPSDSTRLSDSHASDSKQTETEVAGGSVSTAPNQDRNSEEISIINAIDCEKQFVSLTSRDDAPQTPPLLEDERPTLKRKKMHDHDDEPAEGLHCSPEHPNKRSKTPPTDEPATPSEEQKPGTELPSPNDVPVTEPPKEAESCSKTIFAPSPQLPIYSPNFSGGFAGFAGSNSTFVLPTSEQSHRPVWATEKVEDNSTDNKVTSVFADDRKQAPETGKTDDGPLQTRVEMITGEEEEEVESELKGVKLFMKRGERDFSTGMLGRAKLLTQKTEGRVKRRIVFRREPLWKVSMNVFLQPAVRCSFDERECILRVILQEPPSQDKLGAHSLTVYALKPGRSCPRQYFKEFAGLVVAGATTNEKAAG